MSCGDLIFLISIIKLSPLLSSEEIVLLELKVKESQRITCLTHQDHKNGNKLQSKSSMKFSCGVLTLKAKF